MDYGSFSIRWLIENHLLELFQINVRQALPFVVSIFIYLLVAGIEELAKFLTTVFALKNNEHFDEAIDAMI